MSNEEKTLFADYGSGFEKKILYNLANHEDFLTKIYSIIEPDHFEVKAHRYIAKCILDVYKENGCLVSFDSLRIRLKQFDDMNAKKQALKISFSITEGDLSEYAKDKDDVQKETLNYCMQRNWTVALKDVIENVQSFDFDSARGLMENVFYKGTKNTESIDYNDIDDRTKTSPRGTIIPTPWKSLNDRIGGGVGKKELMVVIGPMGTGKSHLATNFSLGPKLLGHDTVLYSLELSASYFRKRIDSLLLKRDLTEEPVESYIEDVKKKLEEFNTGNLYIEKINSSGSTITAIDLKNDIKQKRMEGKNIEFIVIDYIDLMEPINKYDRSKQPWDKFEVITREIRTIVCEGENVSGVALIQGNTSSIDLKAVWAKDTSGGAKRLHPADIIMGWARNNQMKEEEKANATIIKNRFGKDGFLLECDTDYSYSMIEMSNIEKFSIEEESQKQAVVDVMGMLKKASEGDIKSGKLIV